MSFRVLGWVLMLTIVLSGSRIASGAEESLNLDEVSAPPPPAPSSHSDRSRPSFMGRFDLTTELNPATGDKSFANNHFFLFLKVDPSAKVRFMGEFVGRSFFEVDYSMLSWLTVKFGKILVPFGDNRYFHHFYGGIQGYGAQGVMFPNVWAEPGFSLGWKLAGGMLDTYVVGAIGSSNANADPSFRSSLSNHQALGFRWSGAPIDRVNLIFSGYRTNYTRGRALNLGGLDLYTDYGAFGILPFRIVRLSAGIANGWVTNSPTSGTTFSRRGDYLQLATKTLGPGEARVRYGTYIDDSRQETSSDVHNLNVGYQLPIEALRILAEYQWNFEAVTETDNDIARLLVSLDF